MTSLESATAPYRQIPQLYRSPTLRWYAWGKLRADRIYPAVLQQLPADSLPILDVGCGIGLMAFYLRLAGRGNAMQGIDADQRKVSGARGALDRWRREHDEAAITFEQADARDLPPFSGHVLLLDVVHYLSPEAQSELLASAARRVAPDGRLILRDALDDGSRRARLTMMQERFSRRIGWLRGERLQFPILESMDAAVAACGLRRLHLEPMTRRNPFNNHLVVWARSDS